MKRSKRYDEQPSSESDAKGNSVAVILERNRDRAINLRPRHGRIRFSALESLHGPERVHVLPAIRISRMLTAGP